MTRRTAERRRATSSPRFRRPVRFRAVGLGFNRSLHRYQCTVRRVRASNRSTPTRFHNRYLRTATDIFVRDKITVVAYVYGRISTNRK